MLKSRNGHTGPPDTLDVIPCDHKSLHDILTFGPKEDSDHLTPNIEMQEYYSSGQISLLNQLFVKLRLKTYNEIIIIIQYFANQFCCFVHHLFKDSKIQNLICIQSKTNRIMIETVNNIHVK